MYFYSESEQQASHSFDLENSRLPSAVNDSDLWFISQSNPEPLATCLNNILKTIVNIRPEKSLMSKMKRLFRLGYAVMTNPNGCELSKAISYKSQCTSRYQFNNAKSIALRIPVAIRKMHVRNRAVDVVFPLSDTTTLLTKAFNFEKQLIAESEPKQVPTNVIKEHYKKIKPLMHRKSRELTKSMILKACGISTHFQARKFGIRNVTKTITEVEAEIARVDELQNVVASLRECDYDSVAEDRVIEKIEAELDLYYKLDETDHNMKRMYNYIRKMKALSGADFCRLTGNCNDNPVALKVLLRQLQTFAQRKNLKVPDLVFELESNIDADLSRAMDITGQCVTECEKANLLSFIEGKNASVREVGLEYAKVKKRIAVAQLKQYLNLVRKNVSLPTSVEKSLPTAKRYGVEKKIENIGGILEEIVFEMKRGADRWRRSSAVALGASEHERYFNIKKPTFKNVQEKLRERINCTVSVTQLKKLCVPARKVRHPGRQQYMCLADIKVSKGYKGFNLKFCPDYKYSNAVYSMKDHTELNCAHALIINKDDAAGIKMDSVQANSQFKYLHLTKNIDLIRRTDYAADKTVNPTIQNSSYLIQKQAATRHIQPSGTVPIAVTKCMAIFKKTPQQHFHDLQMVIKNPAVKTITDSGKIKIWIYRRDGGADETPSRRLCQFYAALDHYRNSHFMTTVSVRYPGGSYRNPVERFNGAIKLAETGLYVPSTIIGQNRSDHATNQRSRELLETNLNAAIQYYHSRVDGACFSKAKIVWLKGAPDDGNRLDTCFVDSVIDSLRRGRHDKLEDLKAENPSLFDHVRTIENLCQRHSQASHISRYYFGLRCCFEPGCQHPICMQSQEDPSIKEQL